MVSYQHIFSKSPTNYPGETYTAKCANPQGESAGVMGLVLLGKALDLSEASYF